MRGVMDAIMVQGAFVSCVLAAGWARAACTRRKEAGRLAHRRTSDAGSTTQPPGPRPRQRGPGVTVVLPVKGVCAYSTSNWDSLLSQDYVGPLELLFVLDSPDDPAHAHIRALQASVGHKEAVRVVLSGQATSCSQKIHSLVAGLRASNPTSAYVLCLDDDVQLHPSAVSELVGRLESDPGLFMATGYPVDLPSPRAGLPTYAALAWHLPLCIAFCAADEAGFVWGGCMLLRRGSLLPHDEHGILQVWLDGGYSDDLLLAAVCTAKGLRVATPPSAVFASRMDGRMSWCQYLNYLHRQLYVLDTYGSPYNKALNHAMMALHVWASAMWASAALAGLGWIGIAAVGWLQGRLLAARPPLLNVLLPSPWAVSAFWMAAAAAHVSLRHMLAAQLRLLACLDPSLQPRPTLGRHFNFAKLWLMFLAANLLVPACAAWAVVSPSVRWSGVTYRKREGRVCAVVHPSMTAQQCKKHRPC